MKFTMICISRRGGKKQPSHVRNYFYKSEVFTNTQVLGHEPVTSQQWGFAVNRMPWE